MAGKKAPPSTPTNEPVTLAHPAAIWTRKIPVISNAPRSSPKPRSDHQWRSRRRPNPEKGRPSRDRPQAHTLAVATRAAPAKNRPGRYGDGPAPARGGGPATAASARDPRSETP